VNLSVANLEVSLDFYRRVLGTELKEQGEKWWCPLGHRRSPRLFL